MNRNLAKTGVLLAMAVSSCGWWSGIDELPGWHPGGGQAPGGEACWADRLPQVPSRQPARPAAESCAALSGAIGWSEADTGTTVGGDDAPLFVGRWIKCGEGGLLDVAHEGIEFGANRRWRSLVRDAAGELVPAAGDGRSGRFYALSRGQLNVLGEGMDAVRVVSFSTDPGADLVRFHGVAPEGGSVVSYYARSQPSPVDGRDNVPSTSDGTCSMVGTWDLAATDQSPSGTFSFDEAGNFVGGPLGSNLCAAHTMYGTYRLSPGLFQLTSNVGMGQCMWWFDAGYPATFDAGCDRVTLVQRFDNCTGGRGHFNGVTVMTRRR